MRRAQASERANGLAGAVAAMSEAVELDPDSMKYRGLRGRLFSMQENWRAAIADFDSVLAAKPDAPSVRYSRGRARAMLDDLDGAIADFEYCTTLEPTAADALALLGSIRHYRGELPQEQSAYR